jgi:SAM-dependent methyltransferase
MRYEPHEYWSNLHARGDLSAVGQSGLPADINAWLYRALEHRVRGFVRRHDLLPVDRAFDVGAGTGYWVNLWHGLGVPRVDGCDLVPDVTARLNAAHGPRGDHFVVSDVGAEDPGLPDERYGLVSVFNVLLHLVDDVPFERGLSNVARLVAPGGHLLLVEPILFDPAYERPRTPEQSSRARPLAAYREPLVAAGLELVDIRGAVALANNPMEAGSPRAFARYNRWWKWVVRRAKRRPGRAWWLGPLVVTADRLAVAAGAAPSSKIALFRRPPVTSVPGEP